jgi:hypothetical protein
MSSKSILIGVKTRSGDFRIHISGDSADLQAIMPMLDRLAGSADNPADFLKRAQPELERHGIVLADILDVSPKAPDLSLVDHIRMIMHTGPADRCYDLVLAAFQVAEQEEIEALLRTPDDLTLVSGYINAILDDLDEHRAVASTELRNVLGPTLAYVVLGPLNE